MEYNKWRDHTEAEIWVTRTINFCVHSHAHKPCLLDLCQGSHIVCTATYIDDKAPCFKLDPNTCKCPYSPNYENIIMVRWVKNLSCFREYTSGEQTACFTKSIRNGKTCPSRVAPSNLINKFPCIWRWECYCLSISLDSGTYLFGIPCSLSKMGTGIYH
jgi:hypothetical protein